MPITAHKSFPDPQRIYESVKIELKDMSPKMKKDIMKLRDFECTAFLESPDYQSGDKDKLDYKICCEIYDYCSFFKSLWFWIICVAAGCLLVYAVTVGMTLFYFSKKMKNGGGGSKSPKRGGGTKSGSKTKSSDK